MLKQNKGITMISLVVTVIVLMILASITTYSGISTAKESRYYNAVQQMKIMQSEVNSWYENQKDGDKTEWNKGLLLSSSGKETQCFTAYNSAKDNNLNGSDIGKIADFKYFSKEKAICPIFFIIFASILYIFSILRKLFISYILVC